MSNTYKSICTLHTVYLSMVLDQSYKERLHSLTALEQQYRAWDEARKNRALLKSDTNEK